MADTHETIRRALQDLSAERNQPGDFFTRWVSAQSVAQRAGVSVATARKHLNNLCDGYTRGHRTIRRQGRVQYLHSATC